MSGYDLSVLWPLSLSGCLSQSNSHMETKLMFKPKQIHKTFIYCWPEEKKKNTEI